MIASEIWGTDIAKIIHTEQRDKVTIIFCNFDMVFPLNATDSKSFLAGSISNGTVVIAANRTINIPILKAVLS